MKTKNFVLSMEEQFPFGEVENEISMGVPDADHHYDQIDLDPPNDSKLITFQYADDLEKNFFNDNIFYSEQIEVKDEKLNEGIEYASTFQVQNQNQMISISEIPFEVMDVQNEVVIEGSNMTNDAYGEAMQNLLNSEMSQTELSEENFRKRKKMKLLIPDLTNTVHVSSVEKVRTPEKPKSLFSHEKTKTIFTPEKPKSLFGSSMGVSRCHICNKYTKRSCYEEHMKEHFEADMVKNDKSEDNSSSNTSNSISTDSEQMTELEFKSDSNDGEFISGNFIDSLTYSHEEEVEDQKFGCDECEYFSFSQDALTHHMKFHECQKTNTCPYCDYTSAQTVTMRAHIKSHESTNSYECAKCTYRTTEKAHFTRHMRRHTGDKPFKCHLCDYSAVQGSALKSHIRRHYGEKPHACPYCNYRSVERTSLVRHIRVHTGEKPHACPYCDYKSIQKSSLKAHLKKHNGEHHECDKCEFKTIQKTCLSRHLKRHNPDKPHKCKLCDYQSVQKASLRTHMRRHYGEKPYQCSHCDYSCVEKTHLNRHLRQHTGERPIFCFVCDYRCIQFSSLVSHYKRHEGTLMTCAFCEFKTVQSEALLNHIKTSHKGTWSNQGIGCPLCDHRCNSKEALDTHMREHIESFAQDAANAVSDKVFRCSLCDFKTISKKHLRTHKLVHTDKVDPNLLSALV